jgi:hypothetical protein
VFTPGKNQKVDMEDDSGTEGDENQSEQNGGERAAVKSRSSRGPKQRDGCKADENRTGAH